MQNLFRIIKPCYINKPNHQRRMCFWVKGHLSAKSATGIAIFYVKGQISNFKFCCSLWKKYIIATLRLKCKYHGLQSHVLQINLWLHFQNMPIKYIVV